MALLREKSLADIKTIDYAEPAAWTPHKDGTTGAVGNKKTGGLMSSNVTIKHKDGSEQVHSCPVNSTITKSNGMLEIRIP